MTQHNRILSEIKRLVQQRFANLPVSVYLYGSRARGEAFPHSDWDLLIVIDDSLSSADAYEKFAFPFTEIGWHLDEQITPIIYTKSQWSAERNSSFYLNVLNDAILL